MSEKSLFPGTFSTEMTSQSFPVSSWIHQHDTSVEQIPDRNRTQPMTGPMTSQTPGECSIHWATRTNGEQSHFTGGYIVWWQPVFSLRFTRTSVKSQKGGMTLAVYRRRRDKAGMAKWRRRRNEKKKLFFFSHVPCFVPLHFSKNVSLHNPYWISREKQTAGTDCQ